MPSNPNPSPRIQFGAAIKALLDSGLTTSKAETISAHGDSTRWLHIVTDSRQITPGDLFLAYKGVTSDAHQHLEKVAVLGAHLLVVEDASKLPANCEIPWIEVSSGRGAWSYLCAAAYGNPQSEMSFLGVTGTNGKTSTVWMIQRLLLAHGIGCATIGTVGAYIGHAHIPTKHTTPDPPDLFRLLRAAADSGVKAVAMEVSSHAICQDKLLPIRYDGAAFTSFSRDHLDFHPSMEEYFAAKMRLFTELCHPNSQNFFCDQMAERLPPDQNRRRILYGETSKDAPSLPGRVSAKVLAKNLKGSEIEITFEPTETLRGFIPYLGDHAVENFTAALLLSQVVMTQPIKPETWQDLPQIPGRLELVSTKNKHVVIDYAHTPDALEKSIVALRDLMNQGHLWVVFGCGGDRDKGKRPLMGNIAQTLADKIIVTSDNPRQEEPDQIIQDILGGTKKPNEIETIPDRRSAIEFALVNSAADDTILIAGKGHEDYQIVGEDVLDFDDRKVARQILESLNA
jgi:UDP-N-acetylmuramoyl-L-alanyl-D-glutamate--2,6-diaminopimelate ligase